eukprot:TRINITY_DN1417_c3_g1_i1.p1 TRINITY_DN1417_c3_g1~~TRINITY_DN1417_c3_g1_i1.p1  ORF type:complete len:1569 (+),score=278.81 TRINITY_DN1417_c3_g1_i1:44-4750(+)
MEDEDWFTLPPAPPRRQSGVSSHSEKHRPPGLRPINDSEPDAVSRHGSLSGILAPPPPQPSKRTTDSYSAAFGDVEMSGIPPPPKRQTVSNRTRHYHKPQRSPPKPATTPRGSKPGITQDGKLEHTHNNGEECVACIVEKQQNQLEAMRHQLAHAKSEAEALREQQTALESQAPQSPTSNALHQASLQGIGDSLAFYKDQIRQLKFQVAQTEATQTNTEDLLREALQRPPMPPAVPIKDSDAQTFGLAQVDILINGERPDSEDETDSDDMPGSPKRGGAGGLDDVTKNELVNRMKTAVGSEVTNALQKSSWLFGQQTTVRDVDENRTLNPDSMTLPRLSLDSGAIHLPEEIFYEMCAAVGETQAASESQAIQVNNASTFWKLTNARIVPIDESVTSQIDQHETLRYIAKAIAPVHFCNRPIGFLFSVIIAAQQEADAAAKRQEDATTAQVHGLGNTKGMGDSSHDDDTPSFQQWIDLAKRVIVLLSKHTQCLQSHVVLFEFEDPRMFSGETQTYAPLQFAVRNGLEEIVLQICDAQDRHVSDFWECGYGLPLHEALDFGSSRENIIGYILRAAANVADDRFGLLKTNSDGDYPFYIALMKACDVPGVMDLMLDLLVKRNFKLNLKWTGYTSFDQSEEWHLLQWAAYQGVDRVFKLTRSHPDFFQKCQQGQHPPPSTPPYRGNTPLHLACMSGSVSVVNIVCHEISQLLKAPSQNIWSEMPTPLHVAAQQCHYKCIEAILDFAKDKWGWSAKVQEEILFGQLEYRTTWTRQTEEFEYSVYTLGLLTLVYRRTELAVLEGTTEDSDHVASNEDEINRLARSIEVANHQVQLFNERHPPKLRSYAESRIKKQFYPWLVFMGMVTFLAASETQWMSDFNYYSSLALENHFDSIAITNSDGVEKTADKLDNQGELVLWMHHMLEKMPETLFFTSTLPVGSTRLRQIIIANDSCSIGPSFFQKTRSGDQPCVGAVSGPRSGVIFFDWLFLTLLKSSRDDYDQYKEPLTLNSGAINRWSSSGETGEGNLISRIGFEYPGSGYVMDFDWGNETAYKQTLADFRGTPGAQYGSDTWMELGTRVLMVSTTFYNPQTDYYVLGHWVFELPPFGGVFVQTNWKSLRLLKSYNNGLDYFELIVEISLGIIVAFMFLRKCLEFRYQLKGHWEGITIRKVHTYLFGALVKVGKGDNLLDIATIAAFLAVFTLRLLIRKEGLDLETLFKEHLTPAGYLETSFYFPFTAIGSDHATRQSAFGIVLMFVYMKILVIVRLHRNVGPISIAIVQTLFNKRILYFGMILLLLLFSLSFAAYFAYGESTNEFSSLFTSLLSLFRIIFGEYWEWDRVRKGQSIYGPLLLLFMLLFGSLLLINVLTAIIFDIYREKNQQSEGSWETDLVDMQINDILHTLHRKGVRARQSDHEESGGGCSSIIESVQSSAALNRKEVEDVIEWNRALIYAKIFPKCPSLFPDTRHESKALKDWAEEERTTETRLESITETVSYSADKIEIIEKQIKDITKLLNEVHERIYPKQGGHRQDIEGTNPASSVKSPVKPNSSTPLRSGGEAGGAPHSTFSTTNMDV